MDDETDDMLVEDPYEKLTMVDLTRLNEYSLFQLAQINRKVAEEVGKRCDAWFEKKRREWCENP